METTKTLTLSDMQRLDVLNLEWSSSPSRDRQMATLVCNYLRLHGMNVVEGNIFDGYRLIDKYKPRLFFISNTVGARNNVDITRYAKSRGCLALSLISEGNFKLQNPFEDETFVWGWNTEQILYEDIHMQWSQRSRDYTERTYPELRGRIKVSGGVGFDVYKIAARPDKQKFLARHGVDGFESVIGVGCWDFGIFDPSDSRYEFNAKVFTRGEIDRFLQDRTDFDRLLLQAVRARPQVLFLVKEHPAVQKGRTASAVESLAGLPNVLFIKNEESISDCIAVCESWFVYESTTALEAWLLGKPTGLINPSGRDFPRDIINQGSPCFTNASEFVDAIDAVCSGRELPDFKTREADRKRIILDAIQWDDGLNHVRAGNMILQLLEDRPGQWATASWRTMMESIHQHALNFGSRWVPVLGRLRSRRRLLLSFDDAMLSSFQTKRMNEQIAFYGSRGMSMKELQKIQCI